MKTREEILQDLPNFYGTENYYALSPLFRSFVLTDGARYLADAASAWWLMDAIASHLSSYRDEDFVVAKFSKKGNEWWKLRLEDGNYNVLAQQAIEYSDFPLDEITLYVIPQPMGDVTLHVILLPSEY